MKIYHNALLKYMRMKANLTDDRYFMDEDKEAIWNWSDEVAKMVWHKIVSKFQEAVEDSCDGEEVEFFTSPFCPFCIYQSTGFYRVKCDKCSYGDRHGICCNDDSDYQMISKIYDKKCEDVNRILTNYMRMLIDDNSNGKNLL